MSSGQNIESRVGGRKNKLVAIVAAGGLALFLAGEATVPDARAAAMQTAATAEQIQSNETFSQRTEKQLRFIHAHMKALIKNHKSGAYKETFTENGIKKQRLVAGFISADHSNYTQLIEEITPGEQLPHIILIADGAPTARYKLHEPVNRATILVRSDSNPGLYELAQGYKTPNSNWANEYYQYAGDSVTKAIGKNPAVPISLDMGAQVMEDFTSEAKVLITAKNSPSGVAA